MELEDRADISDTEEAEVDRRDRQDLWDEEALLEQEAIQIDRNTKADDADNDNNDANDEDVIDNSEE